METKTRKSMIELHTHTHTHTNSIMESINEITREFYALRYIS